MPFMRDEIFEQPDIVARLAADLAPYREAVAAARASGARFVLYAARGTSDNAAVYGKYLATIHAGPTSGSKAKGSAATMTLMSEASLGAAGLPSMSRGVW
jgi:glucosamine--fructose-6-phosphate aminotransferase (isomerizing)